MIEDRTMDAFKDDFSDSIEGKESGTLPQAICGLLGRLGLPAVFVVPTAMEVVAFNELFAGLVVSSPNRDYRVWFIEAVLPFIDDRLKADWRAASEKFEGFTAPVQLLLADGRKRDYEMRSVRMNDEGATRGLIACIFFPFPVAESGKGHGSAIERGRAIERAHIRNELHKNVSQKLLGAAFGCKVLAGKIEGLSETHAKEASALAGLLNDAVLDLQNLTRHG